MWWVKQKDAEPSRSASVYEHCTLFPAEDFLWCVSGAELAVSRLAGESRVNQQEQTCGRLEAVQCGEK